MLCVNNRLLNQASLGSTSYNYTYDNNGNMETGGGRTLGYTAFNMPATVDYNGKRETYGYGPDYSRVTKEIKTLSSGVVTETTSYLGKLYERIDRAGVVEERFYISAGDRLVAQINKTGGTATAHYIHTDMLGSVETVTNGAMTPLNNLSFDAFGLARKETWQDGAPVSAFTKTTRGYTGHETDIGTGLVNMNARLYDPWLGRFVQADTLIPDVYNPQSVNPYSYVLNNPFRYTDPTGHEFIGRHGDFTFFNDGFTGKPYAVYDASLGQYDFIDGSTIGIPGSFVNPASAHGQDVFANKWGNCVGVECGTVSMISFNAHMPANERAAFLSAGAQPQSGCGGRASACHGTPYIYKAEAPRREAGLQNVADWLTPAGAQLKAGGAAIGGVFGSLGKFGDDAAKVVSNSGARIAAKDGTEITGLTRHGVDRVIGDGGKRAGTKPDAILNAIKSPIKIKEGVDSQGRPFKVYTGENARVVVNPETGKIISTNPLSGAGAN